MMIVRTTMPDFFDKMKTKNISPVFQYTHATGLFEFKRHELPLRGYQKQFLAELSLLLRRGIEHGVTVVYGVYTNGVDWIYARCDLDGVTPDMSVSTRRSLRTVITTTTHCTQLNDIYVILDAYGDVTEAMEDMKLMLRAMNKAADNCEAWFASNCKTKRFKTEINDLYEVMTEAPDDFLRSKYRADKECEMPVVDEPKY